ncbi:hypothetical protein H0H93_010156 [Arthromyces matolae]|nr:hypothetical protein H0H93_010156 [Arthromyces matolae]
MATTLFQTNKVSVSGPFHLNSRQPVPSKPSQASSSRSPQPGDASDASSTSVVSALTQPSTKALNRIRSTLEQSLRSATRSKKPSPPTDEFATITAMNIKGKERDIDPPGARKDKEKTGMLSKFETKVTFRRAAGRETPSPLPPIAVEKDPIDKVRMAGFTSFVTPSMRQGSMSSPSLHLASQAIPSPKSRPAIPISSSSKSDIYTTPTRERSRTQSTNPLKRDTSPSATNVSRRDASGQISGANQAHITRHRSSRSVPLAVPPTSHSSRSNHSDSNGNQSPETPTPTRRIHDIPSPPVTPNPMSGSGQPLRTVTSGRGYASSSHLPLSTSSPESPHSPRTSSPIHPRTTRVITPRGLSSSSTSHLPISPSTPRRSSVDVPRRPSGEAPRRGISPETTRRPSGDYARRASIDTGSPHDSPSPSPRPRPVSPGQRLYMQNRHFNISSASLSGPPNPEFRELLRTASTLLCKETVKIPPHMNKTESGMRDWDEVEVRTRALSRAERIWGKSKVATGGSSSNLGTSGGSNMGINGDERERRLFADALRDGYVLCQLMNKLRSASIVKPDARDDGVIRTSNITKFLAACSSYGLPEEDLFLPDDLIEATGESLARVARTIIALVKFVDAPIVDKSKIIQGRGKRPPPISIPKPYQEGAASTRASASTPNLISLDTSAAATSLAKKGQSKRSDSVEKTIRGSPQIELEVNVPRATPSRTNDPNTPHIMSPPPKSPLRAKSSKAKRNEMSELTIWAKAAASPSQRFPTASSPVSGGDDLISEPYDPRQSVVSSAVTETTATTDISSILDFSRSSSGNNKYGTIRTVTTDLTSEAPSMTRTEGKIIAEELAYKKGAELKQHRDRKSNEVALVDLSRVIEEGDDSGSSSSRSKDKPTHTKAIVEPGKASALHLGKGMWPDDFMEAFSPKSPIRSITPKSPTPELEGTTRMASPTSSTPPRKVAVIASPRRNDGLDVQFPRRPTHRPRQSVDAPILMPKESLLECDSSPDGLSASAGGRVMPRRHSTKTAAGGVTRSGAVHFATRNEEQAAVADRGVPFPQVSIAETNITSPPEGRPQIPRGRFQSDINDSSSRRRARPTSQDELGARPLRSRIESMVNLGAGSTNASASDLLARGPDGESAVRKILTIREEMKPPTHFQLGNCIGRGQFGSVYRALNLNTGQMVAVKRIRLAGLKESEITTLMREVDLMKSLSHPSIVKYEGMERDADTLSIVLEYAENGSLGQTLKAFGKLNERLVASYVVKILEGLHYLHSSDVVHCDLKAANILTTKNGNVKLSDFGVSLNLRAMEREIKDVAGTPNWMAPEVIELKGPSPKSDIWSLACTVIELLTGKPPYAEISNSMTVMYNIVEDDMPPLPPSSSPLLQDFLTICFNKDPRKRPSALTLFQHPWLEHNWGIDKELRPQDSIPFLRRVSADLQKSEFVRYLSQLETPDFLSADNVGQGGPSPLGRRISDASIRPSPLVDSDISPSEHQFVKTTFSKRQYIPNYSNCASNAPPTCDLRSQLLLYAKYAEQGHTTSAYSNPADGIRETLKGPTSDVSYVAHSRASIDSSSPTPQPSMTTQPVHPPTAYKFLGFKRSRHSLSPEPSPAASSSQPPQTTDKPKDEAFIRRKTHGPTKSSKERPQSLSSSHNTDPNSLRSTLAESLSIRDRPRSVVNSDIDARRSGHSEAGKASHVGERSSSNTEDVASLTGHIPGALQLPLSPESVMHRHKKREKSPGCSVQ